MFCSSKPSWLDYSEPCVTTSGSAVSKRNVLERYRFLRDDHLRYMAKWGLIRPLRNGSDTHYAFPDLALLRQADVELADGGPFRAVLRNLLAEKSGQLALAFRIDAPV